VKVSLKFVLLEELILPFASNIAAYGHKPITDLPNLTVLSWDSRFFMLSHDKVFKSHDFWGLCLIKVYL
jgi:hypothetical protein